MKFFTFLSFLAFFILTSFCFKNNEDKVKDYLTIPGPINYNETSYKLTWSTHPNENYYKQEYLPLSEKPGAFTQKILVEAIVGSVSLEEAVRLKISELNYRKKTDQVVNYNLTENPNTGEFLLDFVISHSSPNQNIVEWNAYRYVPLQNQSGVEGVLLLGYSKLSYGETGNSFLEELKKQRLNHMEILSKYEVPKVKL